MAVDSNGGILVCQCTSTEDWFLDTRAKIVAELELERLEWLKGVPGPRKVMMKNAHGPPLPV